jgi:hypothetical protein
MPLKPRPRSAFFMFDESGEASMTADQVLIEERESNFSGLYDAKGNKLYREPESVPFGFRKGR